MQARIAVLTGALALAASAAAAETYHCPLIITDPGTAPRIDQGQYVDLTVDGNAVKSVIHITNASKDLTFASCASLSSDGSNYAKWFAIECKPLAGADGGSFTVDVYLAGAYAGISPLIDESYSMYSPIAGIGKQLGIGTPQRTFVIYAGRQPQHEFFCYTPKYNPDGVANIFRW
jgi:hypothetical protein